MSIRRECEGECAPFAHLGQQLVRIAELLIDLLRLHTRNAHMAATVSFTAIETSRTYVVARVLDLIALLIQIGDDVLADLRATQRRSAQRDRQPKRPADLFGLRQRLARLLQHCERLAGPLRLQANNTHTR